MPYGLDDMHVFYDADGFGTQCARRRSGVDDVPFIGIVGAVDELGLDGYAITAENGLRFITTAVDLDEGDTVIVGCDRDGDGAVLLVAGAVQGGAPFKVRREPRRINDGAESKTLLSSVGTP